MDDEQRIPNQAANQEPAEGSRETVNEESSSEERDRFDNSDTRSDAANRRAESRIGRSMRRSRTNARCLRAAT